MAWSRLPDFVYDPQPRQMSGAFFIPCPYIYTGLKPIVGIEEKHGVYLFQMRPEYCKVDISGSRRIPRAMQRRESNGNSDQEKVKFPNP
jgi:hypothetical protein